MKAMMKVWMLFLVLTLIFITAEAADDYLNAGLGPCNIAQYNFADCTPPIPTPVRYWAPWIFVCDADADSIFMVDSEGTVLDSFPSPALDPHALAIGAYGGDPGVFMIYVSCISTDWIYLVATPSGAVLDSFPAEGEDVLAPETTNPECRGLTDLQTHGCYYPPEGSCDIMCPEEGPHYIEVVDSVWTANLDSLCCYTDDGDSCVYAMTIPAPGDSASGLEWAWAGALGHVDSLWVCDSGADMIYVVSTADGAIGTSFPAPRSNPTGICAALIIPASDSIEYMDAFVVSLWESTDVPDSLFQLSVPGGDVFDSCATIPQCNISGAGGGPPSDTVSVVITEVMYDDTAMTDAEWVEIHNITASTAVDLSGWVLTDGSVYPPPSTEGAIMIPAGTMLAPGGFVVLAKAAIPEFAGEIVCAEIDASWILSNSGDNLALYNDDGLLVDGSLTITFPDLSVGNAGNSIEKCDVSSPWSGAAADWHESFCLFSSVGRYRHCTPGTANGRCPCDTVSVSDLIIYIYDDGAGSTYPVLYFTAPGPGSYQIYATALPNAASDPPGPDWTLIYVLEIETAGPSAFGEDLLPLSNYRRYGIIRVCPCP